MSRSYASCPLGAFMACSGTASPSETVSVSIIGLYVITVSEMLDINSAFTWLIIKEDFIANQRRFNKICSSQLVHWQGKG
jgi:hypothetical protein